MSPSHSPHPLRRLGVSGRCRKPAAHWLLVIALSVPMPGWAFGWSDFWERRDQQAARALEQGAWERAAELAQDPLQRGTAEYRAGRYPQALAAFAAASGPDAAYNRGNTLAKLGRYREAIAAYDEALALQPIMEDAQINRRRVQEWLQRQSAQPAQQQGSQQNAQPGQQQPSDPDREPSPQNGRGQGGQTEPPNPDKEHAGRSAPEGQTDTAAGNRKPPSAARQSLEPGRQQPDTVLDKTTAGRASAASETPADSLSSEQRQVLEQWLRRIPDDPGGLLRRKFLYQYQQRGMEAGEESGQEW